MQVGKAVGHFGWKYKLNGSIMNNSPDLPRWEGAHHRGIRASSSFLPLDGILNYLLLSEVRLDSEHPA